MNTNLQFDFTVDKENKRINVKREFAASPDKVWAAWTQKELLDQWWAPKPWKAETKILDFNPGGKWIYAMVSPEGEKHWSLATYDSIENQKNFAGLSAFSDENGTINTEMPQSNWSNSFSGKGEHTLVDINIQYDKLEDLEAEIEMGFKEGFAMGLSNLDELLASQK